MTLTDDDLKALKDLIETTVDEVFERREVANKDAISHLLTKGELYEETGEIVKRLDEIKSINST